MNFITKIVAAAAFCMTSTAAVALDTKPVLNLETAQVMAQACLAHQEANG